MTAKTITEVYLNAEDPYSDTQQANVDRDSAAIVAALKKSAPPEDPVALSARKAQKPRRLERKLMSLAEIPVRLDAATAQLQAALKTGLLNIAHSTTQVITLSATRAAARTLLEPTLLDIAEYGAAEVRQELRRQGATIDEPSRLPPGPRALETITQLTHDLEEDLLTVKKEVLRKLKRRKLNADKRRKASIEQLERRLGALANRYARRAVNEAFASGRAGEIKRLRAPRPAGTLDLAAPAGTYVIEQVIMTSALDGNVCDECDKVDGKVMDYGSDEQQELEPPYYLCRGDKFCRCQQIALLTDGDILTIVDGEITDDSGEVIDREEVISVDDEDTIE